mgnify:CR=1 FL=1
MRARTGCRMCVCVLVLWWTFFIFLQILFAPAFYESKVIQKKKKRLLLSYNVAYFLALVRWWKMQKHLLYNHNNNGQKDWI